MADEATVAGLGQPIVSFRALAGGRLLIGLIVLICAEVFSGASVQVGLWHPWTWIVTFWLYFAHFFFFTTLAVRTGRTSAASLYLWGVLFGLYEGWITKVIWSGYGGDGKFVLGAIGPFGFSEMSMVLLFHPVMSFMVPLAVACLLYPPLRSLFPGLAWMTGGTWRGRLLRGYIIFSFMVIVAMNSGGPVHLALNHAFILCLLLLMLYIGRPGRYIGEAQSIIVFGRRGFRRLCIYLAVLYGVTYPLLRREALPGASAQLLTGAMYALVIAALLLHPRQEPRPIDIAVQPAERRRAVVVLAATLGLGLLLSALPISPAIYAVIVLNFVLWTPLGLVLTGAATWRGSNRRLSPAAAG
jgi:hypothetical protein